MNIISRDEAKARGLQTFYTGVPCKKGHDSERRVSNKMCVTCYKEWYVNNKARHQKNMKENYAQNSNQYKKRARDWEETNPEKAKQADREWHRKQRQEQKKKKGG